MIILEVDSPKVVRVLWCWLFCRHIFNRRIMAQSIDPLSIR